MRVFKINNIYFLLESWNLSEYRAVLLVLADVISKCFRDNRFSSKHNLTDVYNLKLRLRGIAIIPKHRSHLCKRSFSNNFAKYMNDLFKYIIEKSRSSSLFITIAIFFIVFFWGWVKFVVRAVGRTVGQLVT